MTDDPPLVDPHTALRRAVLATSCLCCGHPLADSTSVATGVGPECRRRLRLPKSFQKNPQANDLTARAALAAEEGRFDDVMPLLANLLALDAAYQPLVDRATARLFKTRVTREPSGTYIVHSSYNEDARLKFRELGMKWDPAKQGWRGTDDQAAAAIKMLCQHDGRRGTSALGADGQLIPLIDPASPMEEHEQ